METQNQRKIRFRGYLKKNLTSLNYLSLIPINESDLKTVEETDRIFESSRNLTFVEKSKYYFDFSNDLFEKIKKVLITFKDSPFYILTEHTFDSGIPQLSSLNDFNWNFTFDNLKFYRVSLLLSDFSNGITFWEADEENNNKIEVEVFGEDWSAAILKMQ